MLILHALPLALERTNLILVAKDFWGKAGPDRKFFRGPGGILKCSRAFTFECAGNGM